MNIKKTLKWYTQPIYWFYVYLPILGFIAMYFISVVPKLDVCKTYYADLSTWTCYWSDYGLPPRSSK